MRTCFLHIGTHNTGTTSIQHMLDRNRSELLRHGYLYPLTGRPANLPGQHNLAWETSGDERFQSDFGQIGDLMKEIQFAPQDVILSSEDFECALYNGTRFSDFVSLLQANDFRVTLILYVRHQVDYLPRIYLTLLHFGLNRTFADILETVLDTGRFQWRHWIINFDYRDVLGRATGDANIECILRSYNEANTSVCRHFLSNFDLTTADLNMAEEVFANQSMPLKGYVRLFMQNRLGRELLETEDVRIGELSWESKRIALSPQVRSKLCEKFRDSNQKLTRKYGVFENELATDEKATSDTYVDELFTDSIELVR